jgi:hypothetical protein
MIMLRVVRYDKYWHMVNPSQSLISQARWKSFQTGEKFERDIEASTSMTVQRQSHLRPQQVL